MGLLVTAEVRAAPLTNRARIPWICEVRLVTICANCQPTGSPLFLSDLLTGHEPARGHLGRFDHASGGAVGIQSQRCIAFSGKSGRDARAPVHGKP